MTKVGTPNEGERYYNSGNTTRGSEKKKLLSSESFEGTYQAIQRGRVYNFPTHVFLRTLIDLVSLLKKVQNQKQDS